MTTVDAGTKTVCKLLMFRAKVPLCCNAVQTNVAETLSVAVVNVAKIFIFHIDCLVAVCQPLIKLLLTYEQRHLLSCTEYLLSCQIDCGIHIWPSTELKRIVGSCFRHRVHAAGKPFDMLTTNTVTSRPRAGSGVVSRAVFAGGSGGSTPCLKCLTPY